MVQPGLFSIKSAKDNRGTTKEKNGLEKGVQEPNLDDSLSTDAVKVAIEETCDQFIIEPDQNSQDVKDRLGSLARYKCIVPMTTIVLGLFCLGSGLAHISTAKRLAYHVLIPAGFVNSVAGAVSYFFWCRKRSKGALTVWVTTLALATTCGLLLVTITTTSGTLSNPCVVDPKVTSATAKGPKKSAFLPVANQLIAGCETLWKQNESTNTLFKLLAVICGDLLAVLHLLQLVLYVCDYCTITETTGIERKKENCYLSEKSTIVHLGTLSERLEAELREQEMIEQALRRTGLL